MNKRITAILLCLLTPGCLLVQTGVTNPVPGLTTVAVAPFFNLSAEKTADGRRFAMAYFAELQKTPGFEVVPVGVTEQAIFDNRLEMDDPRDAITLANLLHVDAVVIGAITDYDPYYPPRIGLKVAWYSPRHWDFVPPADAMVDGASFGIFGTKSDGPLDGDAGSCHRRRWGARCVRGQSPDDASSAATDATEIEENWQPVDESNWGILDFERTDTPDGAGGTIEPPELTETDISNKPPEPQVDAAVSAMSSHEHPWDADAFWAESDFWQQDSTAVVVDSARDEGRDDMTADSDTTAVRTVAAIELPPHDEAIVPVESGTSAASPAQPPPETPRVFDPQEPLMSYARIFDGADANLVARLRDYVALSGDRRSGGWEAYLHRSEDFIRFTAHVMIVEMLTLHGGEGHRRFVLSRRKW